MRKLKLAGQLKVLMDQSRIDMKTLSVSSEVPLKTLYGWTAGSRPRSIEDVLKVAVVLGVPMEELLFGRQGVVGLELVAKTCQEELAAWLRLMRERVRLSLTEASEASGLSEERLALWEQDGNIPLTHLVLLTKVYQVPSEVLSAKLNQLINLVSQVER